MWHADRHSNVLIWLDYRSARKLGADQRRNLLILLFPAGSQLGAEQQFRRIFSRFEKLGALFLGFILFALIVDAVRWC